jgi:site-specific DNA-cytosine methylase
MPVAAALFILRTALLSTSIANAHSAMRSAIAELEDVSVTPVPVEKPTRKKEPPPLKVLSLFDGISCARVALDKVGYSHVDYYASELDKNAIQIAQKNWPETHQLGDVREVTKMDGVFLLVGGSPCQDLSIAKAGRKGLDGERSGLFWEYVRIKNESAPTWFILENVASMSKEASDIISAEMGVEPVMINAGLVSAQFRERLFWTNIPIVGLPEDRHVVLKDILVKEPDDKYSLGDVHFTPMPNKVFTPSGLIRVGYIGNTTSEDSGTWPMEARVFSLAGKSPTLMTRYPPNIDDGKTRRSLTPIECERLQGLPDNYTYGISDAHRIHALGNAFHVDVVAWILSFIPR